VTLGNEFEVVDRHQLQASDPAKGIFPETRKIVIEDGGSFVLHPGENVLGKQKNLLALT